ncbi:hypothetical protein [Methanolobus sp.]|uniref:hypothetical protein n=1 Tax=Methanolobus sp. TaxID=1874737 RepID=UPI0025FA0814|nr:hypothetical protein [Methanolobus sp.]
MSSEISTYPADGIACPYCGCINQSPKFPALVPGNIDYDMQGCRACKKPIVIESKVEVVRIPRRVEGIEQPAIPSPEEVQKDIEESIENEEMVIERIQCADCSGLFAGHEVKYIDYAFHCRSCLEKSNPSGTQPDEEQFHCPECGMIYPIEKKCLKDGMCMECSESFIDIGETIKRARESKQHEPEYTPVPESKTVSYRIEGDIVHLQYKGNDCNAYNFEVIWSIVDSPMSDWMKQIDSMIENENNRIQKASALNQFCKAVHKEDVKLPEVA